MVDFAFCEIHNCIHALWLKQVAVSWLARFPYLPTIQLAEHLGVQQEAQEQRFSTFPTPDLHLPTTSVEHVCAAGWEKNINF